MEYILIIISAIFVNNILLSQFLGVCPFLGVSNKLSTASGMSMAVCFTLSLTVLGLVREILGSGSAFGFKFIEGDGILAFVLAPGAFLALGYLIVIFRKLTSKKAE